MLRFLLDNPLINNPLIIKLIMRLITKRLIKRGANIGKNVFLGFNVFIEAGSEYLLTIEDDVVVAAFSRFIFHDSSLLNVRRYNIQFGKIILRRNCYIGVDTLILPGSEVGENTIVGAGSLVKGYLKPNSVYVGRPAEYYCSVAELQREWEKDKLSKRDTVFYVPAKKWYLRTGKDRAQMERRKLSHVRRQMRHPLIKREGRGNG
jgi:acetyltransferase-like isoleucine patch superfamily enzyme